MPTANPYICTSCIEERATNPRIQCDHEELRPCSSCIKRHRTEEECILVSCDDPALEELQKHSTIVSDLENAEAPGGIPPPILGYQTTLATVVAGLFERLNDQQAIKAEHAENEMPDARRDPETAIELRRVREELREMELRLEALQNMQAEAKIPIFCHLVQKHLVSSIIDGLESLRGSEPSRPLLLLQLRGPAFLKWQLESNLSRLSEEDHATWLSTLLVSNEWKEHAVLVMSSKTWSTKLTMSRGTASRVFSPGFEPGSRVKAEIVKKEKKIKAEGRKRKRETPARRRRDSDDEPLLSRIKRPRMELRPGPPRNYREPHGTGRVFEIPDDATYVPTVFGDGD